MSIKHSWALIFAILLFPIYQASAQNSAVDCIKGDCQNGYGTYVFPSGARYIGDFKDGKLHGKGIFYFSNGDKYIGNWEYQYRQGEGRLIYASGNEYLGNFERNKRQGMGTMTYANGNRYDGQWNENKPTGKGTFFYANGDRYEGSFLDGYCHGAGVMFYNNGDRYEGNWLQNNRHGKGSLFLESGEEFAGHWEEDQYALYNKPFSVSIIDTSDLRDCNLYTCYDGIGRWVSPDKTLYVGEFANQEPYGTGNAFYSNGDRYLGAWKYDGPHGVGVMYLASGEVVGAMWDCGEPVRILYSQSQMFERSGKIIEEDPEVKIWAVVVGAARYSHMPTLRYTDDDAYQLYAFLKSPEGGALPDEQLKVLIDEEATHTNIIQAMRGTILKADKNDVVLFYFSGHGLPGCFLPVDYDGDLNKLYHKEIQKIFQLSRAKHKLVVADACHSGSYSTKRSTFEGVLDEYYNAFETASSGTALMMSSKGEEYSLEDGGLRSGVFSHFLIKGLKGQADVNRDQMVSITELFEFVYRKVRNYTGNVQTPLLTGDYDPFMPVAIIR